MTLSHLLTWTVTLTLLTDQPTPEQKTPEKLPLSGLAPSKLVPDLCLVRYRVSTASPECQAFFDQGLGYFYSYVWMEAARSFETAARHDPDCAMAWWGLSRALEKWGKRNSNDALKKAQELLPKASHREQFLINARLQEKGMFPGVKPENRKTDAVKTIDELLTLYEDDEEGWFARAQLAGGTAAVPYYRALLRYNPVHPGANHELVHFYEGYKRPALGWVPAEKYIESSPGIPHAFHMQAHLAMRLGRWDRTTDRSARAVELEMAYHKELNVNPKDDHQYSHHLETLLRSLVHDGRFREAQAIKEEAKKHGYQHTMPWFSLHMGERNWAEALKIADEHRRRDKTTASYLAAHVYLAQDDPLRATPEVEVLQEALRNRKSDRRLESQLWEVQGLLMCQTGGADAGVKLLEKTVQRTKDDYSHHSWAQGAYYMLHWGVGALKAGREDAAEEAFLEALAHEAGCARAALGLQVLCERQGRSEEADRYAALARRCWARADPGQLETELAWLRQEYRGLTAESPRTPRTDTPSPHIK